MTRFTETGRARTLALILLLAVAGTLAVGLFTGLAGCGKQETATRHVRLGRLNNDLHQLAFYVAQQKGYFEAEGLEVEVAGVYASGPDEMSAFQAGALDAGYLGMAPAMLAVANGKANVKGLAQANLNGSAIVVRDPGTIAGVVDLKNRKVATPNPGTVQDFLLRRALENEGLAIRDVNEVFMAPPEMLAALSSSSIDACVFWEPNVATAESKGLGAVLLDSSRIWDNHPCCALVVSQNFLQADPEAASALARAHARATAFIRDNPEEAVRMAAAFTGLDEAVVKQAMGRIVFTSEFNVAAIREYARFLAEQGLVNIDDPDAFVDGFLYQP
jgi:NitT/TauT family transport system substrate-binding protein